MCGSWKPVSVCSCSIVTAADIRATPSIHLSARNPLRALVDRALAQAGADGSPVGLDTDEYGLILTSVHRGHGFSCMFRSVETEVSQASGLVRVPLEHPIPALQVRKITRHSARHDPLANDLIERLTKTLKEA
jgi:DNA-binding transcriptional LysR family regulator